MKISCPNCQRHYEIGSPGQYRCAGCNTEMNITQSDFIGGKSSQKNQSTVGKPVEYYILKTAGLLITAVGILSALGMAKGGAIALALLPLTLLGSLLVGALFCAAATALNYLREIRNHIVNQ